MDFQGENVPNSSQDPGALKISVVIPTFNRASLVVRAVRSALNQSHAPAEVIVVDDGSQDDTLIQLKIFQDRIRYVYQNNAGAPSARNHGLRLASHPWVALLDSDDVWVGDHLARMARAICATRGKAVCYFSDSLEPPDRGGGSLWEKLHFRIEGAFRFMEDGTPWVMMERQPMMLQSAVFNRSAFWRVGGFLEALRYRDDTHLFLKIGLGAPVCAVAGCGAIMSSDDANQNRLTLMHDGLERGTQMQVIMNRDLLHTLSSLSAETRETLQIRLANAYQGLAKHALLKGRYREFLFLGALSASQHPRHFLRYLWTRMTRPGKTLEDGEVRPEGSAHDPNRSV